MPVKNIPEVDIVVPVWNRPTETRDCLVSLITHSPAARFILVDNGSERETQRILQEFAEGLDQRALLITNDVNQGVVKAYNRGLERSEAPYVVLVRNNTTVSPGWLEPLLETARTVGSVGVLVPNLVNRKPDATSRDSAESVELVCGSFAAMMVARRAYDIVGGFDEEMDGGVWCLRDYSRRCSRAGFKTVRVPGGKVFYEDEIQLGSLARREATLEHSINLFRERWGEEGEYLLLFPKGTDVNILGHKLELLLKGARHGHRFEVVLPSGLWKQAQKAGIRIGHENITLQELPFFMADSRLRKIVARFSTACPGAKIVTGIDGMSFPEYNDFIPFSDLEHLIGG
jgi:GT2 family glycosyltransferase